MRACVCAYTYTYTYQGFRVNVQLSFEGARAEVEVEAPLESVPDKALVGTHRPVCGGVGVRGLVSVFVYSFASSTGTQHAATHIDT